MNDNHSSPLQVLKNKLKLIKSEFDLCLTFDKNESKLINKRILIKNNSLYYTASFTDYDASFSNYLLSYLKYLNIFKYFQENKSLDLLNYINRYNNNIIFNEDINKINQYNNMINILFYYNNEIVEKNLLQYIFLSHLLLNDVESIELYLKDYDQTLMKQKDTYYSFITSVLRLINNSDHCKSNNIYFKEEIINKEYKFDVYFSRTSLFLICQLNYCKLLLILLQKNFYFNCKDAIKR